MANVLGIIHGGKKSGSDTKVYIDNVKQDDVTKVEITNKKGAYLLNLIGDLQIETTPCGEYVPLAYVSTSSSYSSRRLVSLKDYTSKIINTPYIGYASEYAIQYFEGFLFEVGRSSFYKYDITNNLWSNSISHSMGSRPQSLYVKDNNLYAKVYTKLYRYNGNTFILEDSNYFPSNTNKEHYDNVAIINNELYVYYKYATSDYTPVIAKKTNDGWQRLANYPSARSGIFEYEGKLAGFNGYNNNLYIYNENADTWDSIGIIENVNFWNNSSATSLANTTSHGSLFYKGTVFFTNAQGIFNTDTNERFFYKTLYNNIRLGLFMFPGRETNLTYKNQE